MCFVAFLIVASYIDVASYDLSAIDALSSEARKQLRLCGPLSLSRLLTVDQREYQLRALIASFDITDEGVLLNELLRTSKQFASGAQLVSLKKSEIKRAILPCIVLVNEGHHCLVLEAISPDGRFLVWDPSDLRTKWLTAQKFESMWTGESLITKGMLASPLQIVLHSIAAISMLFAATRALGRSASEG